MPLSGTVPHFSLSPTPPPTGPTVVTITPGISGGAATGANSTEGLAAFFKRAVIALSLSGTLGDDGVTSGMQAFTDAQVSGLRAIQHELACRATDIELDGDEGNTMRLAHANAILSVSGEMQLGS